MKITDVKVNAADPKAKTEIQGTITRLLPLLDKDGSSVLQLPMERGGVKQMVVCDGVTAAFFGQTALKVEEMNKSATWLCKASIYNSQIQYVITRAGSSSGKGGYRDYRTAEKEKNISIALSYALSKDHLNLSYGAPAFLKALEMAEFIETRKLPIFVQAQALVPSREDELAAELAREGIDPAYEEAKDAAQSRMDDDSPFPE